MKTKRKGRWLIAWLATLPIVLAAILVIWELLHSAWFVNQVRIHLIAAIERSSGARVEIGSLAFDPETLQARLRHIVVHGTEPSGSTPLLTIDSFDVRIKILSFWRQKLDIRSVVLERPRISLLVNANGMTNIPRPKRLDPKTPLEHLFDLKIQHVDINNGLLAVANYVVPFHLTTQDVSLILNYDSAGNNYQTSLHADLGNASMFSSKISPVLLDATTLVFQNRVVVNSLKLLTANTSRAEWSGEIGDFQHPEIEGKLKADISMTELTRLGAIDTQLRDGRGTFSGTTHFESLTKRFRFDGKAEARGVNLFLPGFILRDMSAHADMIADNDGMLLNHAQGEARGAHFAGSGSIKNYNLLNVSGNVSQVALSIVGSYLTNKAFPWSGMASGTAHASAHLLEKEPDFRIGADVDISPGHSDIPTAGHVGVTYFNRTTEVAFTPSHIQLPSTSIDLDGNLSADLALDVQSNNLSDLSPLLPILNSPMSNASLPKFSEGGAAHFKGDLLSAFKKSVSLQGWVDIDHFTYQRSDWNTLNAQVALAADHLTVSTFRLQQWGTSLEGSFSSQLTQWELTNNSTFDVKAHFKDLDVVKTLSFVASSHLPIESGIASGTFTVGGTLENAEGAGNFTANNLGVFGEHVDRLQFDAALHRQQVEISNGQAQAGPAQLKFSIRYNYPGVDWRKGQVSIRADTNSFPINSFRMIRARLSGFNAHAELHTSIAGQLNGTSFEASGLSGSARLSDVTLGGNLLGQSVLTAVTNGTGIDFSYQGRLEKTRLSGAAHAQLTHGTPIKGDLQMDRIDFAMLRKLMANSNTQIPLNGFLEGALTFDGLLEDPKEMHVHADIGQLEAGSPASPELMVRNNGPINIDLIHGLAEVTRFELAGTDTTLKVSGTAPIWSAGRAKRALDLRVAGRVDLRLFRLLDASLKSTGKSKLTASVTGSFNAPNINGNVEIQNGSFFLPDVANGLSDVNGTLVFNRNRATIQKMSAHSGGGVISLGGFVGFGEGAPLVYHLEADAHDVRVRYANSISVTANSQLRLSGTSSNSILSGTLTVTRIVFNPTADAGNLLAAVSSATPSASDQTGFVSGLHLDIAIDSTPDLQVSTNLSHDVEAALAMHVRGTPDRPIVLGNITANQGDLKIFGTSFSLNRGEVNFVNPVRIEPVLDLDLETQARGVTVDITVSGPPSKLSFNYRSDPPLQPRDIIALLTVGRTPEVGTASNVASGSDFGALASGVNSVLGQAISPVSNRLSKLFGVTNIKIDPFVQGITNTPQARLSVEQQVSRNVTVTYVTNLSQTSEQIFRFEWALNRQFSIVALRDDNGEFGIDFQYKKQFK